MEGRLQGDPKIKKMSNLRKRIGTTRKDGGKTSKEEYRHNIQGEYTDRVSV